MQLFIDPKDPQWTEKTNERNYRLLIGFLVLTAVANAVALILYLIPD